MYNMLFETKDSRSHFSEAFSIILAMRASKAWMFNTIQRSICVPYFLTKWNEIGISNKKLMTHTVTINNDNYFGLNQSFLWIWRLCECFWHFTCAEIVVVFLCVPFSVQSIHGIMLENPFENHKYPPMPSLCADNNHNIFGHIGRRSVKREWKRERVRLPFHSLCEYPRIKIINRSL